MSWSNPNAPNLPDFVLFARNAMGVAPEYLPADSPFFGYAFNQALNLVLTGNGAIAGNDYTLAVYNCAGHILLRITPDQSGRTFFAEQVKKYGLDKLSAGMVASASDTGTASTIAVPEALKELTLGDLNFMKTPWGRAYLSYAQDYGPSVWGLS